jgi:DNA-3-methyladenine glycosylase
MDAKPWLVNSTADPHDAPMPAHILSRSWFHASTPERARDLLGKTLCRRCADGSIVRSRITETEAYEGFDDRASHAHRGPTPRNEVMFGPPGVCYVYLCYGVHWLLNLTTREAGLPAAILVRGTQAVQGPGKLTRHFEINGAQDRQPLYRTRGLWIEDTPSFPARETLSTPRIGIDYAGPEWAAKPWRFVWQPGSSF